MAKFELRNPRMINHAAYHDMFKDGIEVLHEKPYSDCYSFVLTHGKDDDSYSEPDACPDYKGETVARMRDKEDLISKYWD